MFSAVVVMLNILKYFLSSSTFDEITIDIKDDDRQNAGFNCESYMTFTTPFGFRKRNEFFQTAARPQLLLSNSEREMCFSNCCKITVTFPFQVY